MNTMNSQKLTRSSGKHLLLQNAAVSGVLAVALALATNATAAAQPSTKPELRDKALASFADDAQASAVSLISSSDFEDNYADDVGDTLFFAQGVWINRLDLNEPRLNLRGFGVGNRQHRSTASIFKDGAPLTDVHGTTNTVEVNAYAVDHIDIYRGGGGDLRFAGDNLGGAFNFLSPTGRTKNSGWTARLDGGSSIEGTPRGRAYADFASVSKGGGVDFYASLTGGYDDGFRDNNERIVGDFNANIGWNISSAVSTRFFINALRHDTELAGGLSIADAEADPSQAAPAIGLGPLFPGGPFISLADGAETGRWDRELTTGRVANQTDFNLFGQTFETGFHYTRREATSQNVEFIGIKEEEGSEWSARLAFGRLLKVFGMDASYQVGGSYSAGSQDSDRFENLQGVRGDQTVDTVQRSSNVNGFVEAMLKPIKRLMIDVGAKFIMTDRELSANGGDFDELRYTGVAARGGASFLLAKRIHLYANASRTYEPPTMEELIADDPENLSGLAEQDAFTIEVGFKGYASDRVRWNIAYFDTDVENEIINIEEPETNGIVGTFVNVPTSEHKGIELGLDIDILPSGKNKNGLTWRSAYSFNDFRFVDAGPIANADGARIAGLPQHVYRGELRYSAGDRWFAAVNVDLAAGEFFADHENVVSVPTYAVVGFSAGLKLSDQLQIFASGENLTDTAYAAGVTPVASQTTQTGRIITPGAGATVYGGMRYVF